MQPSSYSSSKSNSKETEDLSFSSDSKQQSGGQDENENPSTLTDLVLEIAAELSDGAAIIRDKHRVKIEKAIRKSRPTRDTVKYAVTKIVSPMSPFLLATCGDIIATNLLANLTVKVKAEESQKRREEDETRSFQMIQQQIKRNETERLRKQAEDEAELARYHAAVGPHGEGLFGLPVPAN